MHSDDRLLLLSSFASDFFYDTAKVNEVVFVSALGGKVAPVRY